MDSSAKTTQKERTPLFPATCIVVSHYAGQYEKKKRIHLSDQLKMWIPNQKTVRVAGLEPARSCPREILSLLCLPIPPYPQTICFAPNRRYVYRTASPAHAPPTGHPGYTAGWRWIRTTEAICSRYTIWPLWPLGNPSISYESNIFIYI